YALPSHPPAPPTHSPLSLHDALPIYTRSLATNLLGEVFQRTALLHDEAELMLRQSIPSPANHIAVLRSIADGHNRNNQISQRTRSEEHTSELQSRFDLVCRLLLEKKK